MRSLIRKYPVVTVIIVALILVATIVYLYIQNNWIEVSQYRIKIHQLPKALKGFRIVHIADTQLPRNAADVPKLLALVREQKPNVIMITGDMIDRTNKDLKASGLNQLTKGLSKICPTYAVTGNHEEDSPFFAEWKQVLAENQVHLLEEEIEILEYSDTKLAILGLGNGIPYDQGWFESEMEQIGEMPIILLAHQPNLAPSFSSSKNTIRPDLVLCGHAHGGQMRLPFVGGVVAPDQGIFPKYTDGVYTLDNGVQMEVSRGLGNSIFPFRINDRPQLPVILLE